MKKVLALIVTYNRKDYLMKLVDSLLLQSRKIDAMLILDNHSTDGTSNELLSRNIIKSEDCSKISENCYKDLKVYYYKNEINTGGSGGFCKGMEIAMSFDFDYLWCMDDDVLPDKTCLQELLKHIDQDHRICIPSRTDDKYIDTAILSINMSNPFSIKYDRRKKIISTHDIKGETIEVVDMPFEGPLIDTNLIKEIGYPNKELFILFDDTDYAYRAGKITKLLFCKNAILHKQIIVNKKLDRLMDWKDYYSIRNQCWFDRTYGKNVLVKVLRPFIFYMNLIVKMIIKRKFDNYRVISKAYNDGIKCRLGILVKPGAKNGDI